MLVMVILISLIVFVATAYVFYVLFSKVATLEIVVSELRAEISSLRRAAQDESFQTTAALTELHASIPVVSTELVEQIEDQALQFLDLVQTTESCLESLSNRVGALESQKSDAITVTVAPVKKTSRRSGKRVSGK